MSIGQSIPMLDALERVSGTLQLTLDHRLPGMAYAKVVRSTYPHALIRRINVADALALPGVITVLTGDDFGPESGVNPHYGPGRADQPVLAMGKVRYVGEPVAVVVAESEEIAAEAAHLIDVDYRELPYVVDAEEAAKPGAPVIHEQWPDNSCGNWKLRYGDIEQGWRESDRIYEHVFRTPSANHVAMEPHVAVAHLDESGCMNVWTAAQAPYRVHSALVKLLNTTPEKVRVMTYNLGGAFGAKGGVRLEPVAVCAARKAGRPVRLALSRDEVFHTIAKHATRVRIKTGVKDDGTIVARQVDVIWNAGAYTVTSMRGARQGLVRAPGPYRIPHVWVDSRAYYTNTVPTGPFRGSMTSQVCWAYESQLDEIAADLGIDPLEMRRKNLLRDGDTYATGEVIKHTHYDELLNEVASAIDWKPEDGAVRQDRGTRVRGKGIAVLLKHTVTPSRSEAKIELADDGTCTVFSSSVEMGQGARTTLLQFVADDLGIPLERIQAPFPDTATTPFDLTTSSSRTAYSMTYALREAAKDLKRQIAELAASLLEVSPGDVTVADDAVTVAGAPGQRLRYAEVLQRVGVAKLAGSGVFQSPEGYGQLDENGQGIASVHWHEGAVGIEVEVDTETGYVHVTRCHAVAYAGRVLNPVIVRQQNEGNVIFGLGPALFEEYVLDEGQLVNSTLVDYMIPSFLDIPDQLTSRALEDDDPNGEIHGVGEMTLPAVAPAIRNAILHATGARIFEVPMTAERVLRAIQAVTWVPGPVRRETKK